jgi:hypothetical protein
VKVSWLEEIVFVQGRAFDFVEEYAFSSTFYLYLLFPNMWLRELRSFNAISCGVAWEMVLSIILWGGTLCVAF